MDFAHELLAHEVGDGYLLLRQMLFSELLSKGFVHVIVSLLI